MIVSEKRLEVLRTLADHPGKDWHVSELARQSGVSQPTASRAVEMLEEENVIDSRKVGRQVRVGVRREEYLEDLVRVLTDKASYMEEAAEKFCERMKRKDWVVACFLFGSVARGTADFESDVDVLVLVGTDPEEVREEILLAAEKAGEETGFHVSPTVMSSERYEEEVSEGTQFASSVEEDKVVLYDQRPSGGREDLAGTREG